MQSKYLWLYVYNEKIYNCILFYKIINYIVIGLKKCSLLLLQYKYGIIL